MAKILIVEDDAFLSDLYLHTFTFSGFDTHIAKNGLEGFDKTTEINPDIILLDIMMPKMNGIELMKKLKEQDATKNIPIVIISNFSDETLTKEAMVNGALAYIIKSEYEPAQIVQVVKDILNGTFVSSQNPPVLGEGS
jgi:DNA-binding response OmpR family regulator